MTEPSDRYFLKRAEAELEAAESATDRRAARAHSTLAGLYFDRFFRRGSADERARLRLKFRLARPPEDGTELGR